MNDLSRRYADEFRRQAAREERMAASPRFESDASYDELKVRYNRLSGELAEISAGFGGFEHELQPRWTKSRSGSAHAADDAVVVRGLIAARRRRARFFSTDMFADPAWDILLDLYLAELEQRRTMVTSLCSAADVPATTALRWIAGLVDRGMLSRRPDKFDRRKVYIELTREASEGMSSYLDDSETSSLQHTSCKKGF